MKKTLLAAGLLFCSMNILAAENNLSLKLEGTFDFRAASNLKGPKDKISKNRKGFGFDSQGFMRGVAKNKVDDDLEYGAIIVLRTQAKPRGTPTVNGSHIFIESTNYGKLQLGSQYDASTLTQVTGDDLSCGNGLGVLSYANFNPKEWYGADPAASYDFFLGSWTDNDDGFSKEAARNITYYTPRFHGLQLGVSFVPDTTNIGGSGPDKGKAKKKSVTLVDNNTYKAELGAKNAVAWAVSFNHVIEDGFDFTIEADGECGKALQKRGIITVAAGNPAIQNNPEDVTLTGDDKLANLKTYNIGGKVNYGNWSVAGSFADLGKSYTSKAADQDRRKTQYYTAAIAYTQGPAKVAVTYLNTDYRKNKLDAIVVSSEYKLFPGLTTYGAIGFAKSKIKSLPTNNKPQQSRKDNHVVGNLGVKISF